MALFYAVHDADDGSCHVLSCSCAPYSTVLDGTVMALLSLDALRRLLMGGSGRPTDCVAPGPPPLLPALLFRVVTPSSLLPVKG